MPHIEEIDYGPLTSLIGVWQGDKGLDIAPEPDGSEQSAYYETITFCPVGHVTNAETQVLAALHYRQIVKRQSNGETFHDETGYWMWDAASGIVMHALTIPRGVSVLAGGRHDGREQNDGNYVLEVEATENDPAWQIIQSPFMRDRARTTAFHHRITVGNDKLSYQETTTVAIYGKVFEHSDSNELTRQA